MKEYVIRLYGKFVTQTSDSSLVLDYLKDGYQAYILCYDRTTRGMIEKPFGSM